MDVDDDDIYSVVVVVVSVYMSCSCLSVRLFEDVIIDKDAYIRNDDISFK